MTAWIDGSGVWPHRQGYDAQEHNDKWAKGAIGRGSPLLQSILDSAIGTRLSSLLEKYDYPSSVPAMDIASLTGLFNSYVEHLEIYRKDLVVVNSAHDALGRHIATDLWRNA